MARRHYFSKSSHQFFDGEREDYTECDIEFHESDLWNAIDPIPETKIIIPSARISKKPGKRPDQGHRPSACSLPMSIPDWSKILGEDYHEGRKRENESEFEVSEEEDDGLVPPHEYLARQFASFSVHVGIGRTLKGRDLSRVRDAIWQRTGFDA